MLSNEILRFHSEIGIDITTGGRFLFSLFVKKTDFFNEFSAQHYCIYMALNIN